MRRTDTPTCAPHGGAALGRPVGAAPVALHRLTRWLALITLAAVAAPAHAGAGNVIAFPIMVRVEGYVGAKPEAQRSLARWVIAIDDQRFVFYVSTLKPMGTDIQFWSILNALEPLPVTARMYGEPQLIEQFTTAPPGQPIAIIANFIPGAGPANLLVQSIEPLPQPASSTTPSAAPVMAPTEGSTPGS